MKSKATRKFWKFYDSLPRNVQQRTRKTYQTWKENPYHPSLHFKRVDEEEPVYSVRVGDDYRVLGILEGDTVIWYWIGNHDEYLRLLR
jgi:mRNA-degrading endonuclease RelE of RelBE toxin-antitoxin system